VTRPRDKEKTGCDWAACSTHFNKDADKTLNERMIDRASDEKSEPTLIVRAMYCTGSILHSAQQLFH